MKSLSGAVLNCRQHVLWIACVSAVGCCAWFSQRNKWWGDCRGCLGAVGCILQDLAMGITGKEQDWCVRLIRGTDYRLVASHYWQWGHGWCMECWFVFNRTFFKGYCLNGARVEGMGIVELPYGSCQCGIMCGGKQGIARWGRGRGFCRMMHVWVVWGGLATGQAASAEVCIVQLIAQEAATEWHWVCRFCLHGMVWQ